MTTTRLPRHARTPDSEAERVIEEAIQLHATWTKATSAATHRAAFTAKWIDPIIADPKSTATLVAMEQTHGLHYLLIACSFAVDALRASASGKPDAVAWSYVCDARHALGYAEALGRVLTQPAPMSRIVAARGGKASHAEDKSMADETKEWCEERLEEYRGKGLNELARACVKAKINSAPQSTVRRQLTEHAKAWKRAGLWD